MIEQVEQSDTRTSFWEPFISQRGVLIICIACAVGLWLVQLNPYLNPADDSGRYMVLGESLARLGQLRLINDARQPFDTLYPHGFPLIIAFWLKVTGREPGGVVLAVKSTQLLLMLETIPMLAVLLYRLKVPRGFISACLICYSLCPTMTSYANEVMSEMPMLFLCLASAICTEGVYGIGGKGRSKEVVGAVQSGDGEPRTVEIPMDDVPVWRRLLGLLLAALAFGVRSSGIALLLAQALWFWRRFGWRWGLLATLVMFGTLGAWILRNRAITKAHPEIHYSSYIDQFSLRDPMRPNAGRIRLNAVGIASRIKSGFPAYVGFLPRSILLMMPHGRWWTVVFWIVAVSITFLMFAGWIVTLRHGYWLTGGFAAIFWFVAAMWPWLSARFLVPIVPLLFVFMFVGVDALLKRLERVSTRAPGLLLVPILWLVLMLLYFFHVQVRVSGQEHQPAATGYSFGRSKAEGGFYAACDWLRHHSDPSAVVMGKPQYLLHLYAGNYTTQMEPNTNPDNLEQACMRKFHVRYVLQDTWPWGIIPSSKILDPYFAKYGNGWELVWTDPAGSGVRVWRRK